MSQAIKKPVNFYHRSSSDLKALLWQLKALPECSANKLYRNLAASILAKRGIK